MPTLTDQQIYQKARDAGFPPETAAKMTAIALKESGGNTEAYNPNAKTGDKSYGLWQINMYETPSYPMGDQRRRAWGLKTNDELFDPDKNADAAKDLWAGNDANLERHWKIVTRDRAKYEQYVGRAQAAASAVEGREVIISTNATAQVTTPPAVKKSGPGKTSTSSPITDEEIREVPDMTGQYTEWRDEGTNPYPEIDVPQPYFATAEIWTHDSSVNQMSSNRSLVFPEINPITIDWREKSDFRLIEFQYEDRRKGAGRFIIRVWMRHYEDVEKFAKLCSEQNGIEFRWGYANVAGGMRDSVKGFVLSYMPEFKESGYEVSIEGCDMAYQTLGQTKVRTFRSLTGRISDVVAYIVTKSGLDPKPVIETTKEIDKLEPLKQSVGQTDWWFINEVLSKRAQSKSQRPDVSGAHAGYSAYMRDGKFHWHTIVPPLGSSRAKAAREYVWGGIKDPAAQKMGTVLSFTPEFNPALFRNIGAGEVFFRSFNPITKELNQSTVIGSDVKDSILGGSKSSVSHWMSPDKYPNRAFSRPDHKPEFLEAAAADRFFTVRDAAFQAQLEILGDPWVGSMDVVNVIVQRPTDPGIILCYDWIVMEAVHTIKVDGTYTTTLKMVRSPSAWVSNEAGEEKRIPSNVRNLDGLTGSGKGSQGDPRVVRKGVLEQKITVSTKVIPARVGEIFG